MESVMQKCKEIAKDAFHKVGKILRDSKMSLEIKKSILNCFCLTKI